MIKCEIPQDALWCGREVPVFRGQNVFQYLAAHDGEPEENFQFKFDLTEKEVDYWLRNFEYLKR